MRWAKIRPRVTYDLASSGLSAVTTTELLGGAYAKDAFDISGSNDEGLLPLRDAIAKRYAVSRDSVAIAPGASGANFLTLLSLLHPGDDVLIEQPAYDPLIGAARTTGANVVHFERRRNNGFALDPDAVLAAMTPATRLIVISNAHNPSGALAGRAVLEEIGSLAAANGSLILIDEVYLEAQHDASPPPETAAKLGDAFVVTNSLTKAYGLAGLRCGWVLASPEVAERIRIARDIVDGSGPFVAERLALTAFSNIDRLRNRARSILETNFGLLRSMVESNPRLEWVPPAAGTTAFPRVRDVADTSAFVDRLISEHDTIVVPGRYFQAPEHIRIGFGGKPDMFKEAVSRLDRALRAV